MARLRYSQKPDLVAVKVLLYETTVLLLLLLISGVTAERVRISGLLMQKKLHAEDVAVKLHFLVQICTRALVCYRICHLSPAPSLSFF